MLTVEQKRNWILENCVDSDGDIILTNLDFSEFDGDVYISQMKVKKCLFQSDHKVDGDLRQRGHKVNGDLCQGEHRVNGDLCQGEHRVRGNLFQSYHKVDGDLYQNYHDVSGDIRQAHSEFGGALYASKFTGYCITEMASDIFKITHKPKQMTMKELEALVGGKFEIVEEE